MRHPHETSRRTVSLIALAAVFLAALIIVPDVLLVIFAGILLGIFFNSGGSWINRRTGLGLGWSIAVFLISLVAVLAAAGAYAAPEIVRQFDELVRQVPEAVQSVRQSLKQYAWAEKMLSRLNPEGLMSSGGGVASMAVASTFGALGNFVIMLFIGIYVALDPRVYRKGFVQLLAPSLRSRGEAALDAAAQTLRQWLSAQLMAMTLVGVLTGLGLWAVGLPLAFILGLIAGLLAFIPNIGPLLAVAPAVLVALSEGLSTVGLVAAVYLGVQTLESYAITPLIQQEKVALPPALIIASQLLFGVLFGILGLALATPIAAAVMALLGMLYVKDFLEQEELANPAKGSPQANVPTQME